MLSPVEHDHLILLRTSEQLLFGTFAHTLYQHFINPAFAMAVALCREFILQSSNAAPSRPPARRRANAWRHTSPAAPNT